MGLEFFFLEEEQVRRYRYSFKYLKSCLVEFEVREQNWGILSRRSMTEAEYLGNSRPDPDGHFDFGFQPTSDIESPGVLGPRTG